MGYDFMLVPFKQTPGREFPVYDGDLDESDLDGELPWDEFRSWLMGIGGVVNFGDPDQVVVDYPDTGQIYFRGSPDTVSLDVHARWSDVLAAFEAMLRLTADCSLLDIQVSEYHDAASFRELMEMNESGAAAPPPPIEG